MADTDQQQQPQTPDLNAILQQLLAPQQVPQTQPVDTASTRPTSTVGLLGEALAGGPPSDVQLTQAQREAEGRRALLNFGIRAMSVGPFDYAGQGIAAGLQGAQASQYGSEAMQAQRQVSAQDWQQQQFTNQIERLKTALPLLRAAQAGAMPNPLLGGGPPGTTPGTSLAAVGLTGDINKDRQIIAQRESGGNPKALNYVAMADPTAYARGATASGKYQFVNSTWQEGMKLAGLDPSKYPTAMSAPEDVQDKVFDAVYGKYGTAPWDPSKWKQNWVPTPTGQFILASAATPSAAPPGGSTAAATPPDGKLPVPPVPPSTTTPAPPGGPFGGGAFAVAPGREGTVASTANAPVTTDAVPPVNTPQMVAAQAQANKTGKPVAIEGTSLFAKPGGGVTLGPGAGGLGKSAAADALARGVATAATTLPPGGGLVAGPGAPGGPGVTTPNVPPPTAFGTAAFGPQGAAPATTTPSEAPTPQATGKADQPPAPPPSATVTPPAPGRLTFEQFQQQHPITLPPTATITIDPARMAEAQAAKETAAQNLQLARMSGDSKAANQAQADYNTASQNVAQLQQQGQIESAKLQQQQITEQLNQQRQLYDAEMQRQQTAEQAELNRQADIRKAELQAGLNIQQKGAEAAIAGAQQKLTDMGTASTEARTVGNQLRLMPGIIDQLPQPGFAAQLAKDHPSLVPWMVQAGALSPEQANATQVMQGLIGYMSVGLRPTGSGALRNAEMDRFQQVLPSMMQSPQGRRDSLSLLQTMQDRIVAEQDFASRYFRRTDPATGNPAYNLDGLDEAIDKPKGQGGLGPIAPTGPQPLTTDANGQPHRATPAEVQQWVHDNVGEGHAYWGWAPKGDGTYQPKLMVRRDNG